MTAMPSWNWLSEAAFQSRCYFRIVVESDGTPTMLMPYWNETLKEITRIHRKNAMRELVHTLAAWSGKFMDLSAIGSGLSIQRPTIESYINALETLYMVERVYPWTKTDYARVGKQSKLFMVDSGLMTSLLSWKMGPGTF